MDDDILRMFYDLEGKGKYIIPIDYYNAILKLKAMLIGGEPTNKYVDRNNLLTFAKCSECKSWVNSKQKFCSQCGRYIKWGNNNDERTK